MVLKLVSKILCSIDDTEQSLTWLFGISLVFVCHTVKDKYQSLNKGWTMEVQVYLSIFSHFKMAATQNNTVWLPGINNGCINNSNNILHLTFTFSHVRLGKVVW